ncbi:MAG: CHRD domain-containing protein [Chitinophagaceae bacterium]
MIRNLQRVFLFAALLAGLVSCSKNDEPIETAFVRKYWNEMASSMFVVPAPAGSEVKAQLFLNLMTDHVFYYDILFGSDYTANDISGAALYYGSAASQGELLADLAPVINGRHLKGKVQLTAEQAQDLMEKQVFLSVASKTQPGGIARLQLEKNIDWAGDVALSGAELDPPSGSSATGKVILRLTTDKVLHYQVQVAGQGGSDVLGLTHVHEYNVSPALSFPLAEAPADYNTVKSVPASDALIKALKTNPVIIDVHSTDFPAGLIGGKLR